MPEGRVRCQEFGLTYLRVNIFLKVIYNYDRGMGTLSYHSEPR